jgi:hypothetical protein
MRTKKSLLALSTAIAFVVLGAATAAQAGSRDDDESGGSKIGPLGQVFSNGPVQNGWNTYGHSNGPVQNGWNTYGYVAPSHHTTHKHSVRPASR